MQKLVMKKNQGITIAVLLLYLSINCFWNLLPLGNTYDFVFIFLMSLLVIKWFKNGIKLCNCNKTDITVILSFIIVIIVFILRSLFILEQSFSETLFAVREMLYFFTVFYFIQRKYSYQRCVHCLIYADVIGAVLYIITFVLGHPIIGFAPYQGSSISVSGVELYRDFSLNPMMQSFSCAYLLGGFIRKEYIRNKRSDLIMFGLIFFSTVIKLFRTKLIVLVLGLFITIIFTGGTGKVKKNSRKWMLLIAGGITAIFVFVPTFTNRFIEGIKDLVTGAFSGIIDPFHGTGTYRLWLFQARINYLLRNNQLLLGMGIISSRNKTQFFSSGRMTDSMALIYNPDSAYLTLIPRYGVVGTLIYLGMLLYFIIVFLKRKTKLSVAAGAYIICMIIEGISGNETLAQYGPLLLSMVIGLTMSEQEGIK